jgi:hypothetical protein
MPLLLPNLDDRKWAELVDQGRALIPVYGPEWTDHNATDPGITLIELLAWIAEMDIYELNQISDRERLKFLKLVDVVPKGPLPAQATMCVTLDNGAPMSLPAGVEFTGNDATLVATRFRTREALTLAPGTLDILQFKNANGFQDLTPAWRRHTTMSTFGPAPQPGMEFYLGLSTSLPVDTPVQFFFTFADSRSVCGERRRIVQELCSLEKDCRPQRNPCEQGASNRDCPEKDAEEIPAPAPEACRPLRHYGVRTVWEFLSADTSKWVALDPAKKEVEDHTRAFTLDGSVVFKLPESKAMEQRIIGAAPGSLYYLRCRFEAGAYDAAPLLEDIAFNGFAVTQSVPSGKSFTIAPGAHITYAHGEPKPNDVTSLTMTLDGQQRIVELAFGGDPAGSPSFLVYEFRAPSDATAGLLNIEGVFLGFGSGFPNQQFTLPGAPVEPSSLRLYTLEKNQWHPWHLRRDFDASTSKDFHAVLDATAGTVTFGTGEKGRVPPEIHTSDAVPFEQCLVFAKYESTRAEAGNLSRGAINQLADSPHNRALFSDPDLKLGRLNDVKKRLTVITNPLVATGGAAAETLAHASGRADLLIQNSDRAVTLKDYERLALQTPGTHIARVSARANLHPSFPCFKAPGMVMVIVLPFLPQDRPMPSPGLLQAVAAYLRRRRIIGTRIEVVAPIYLDVSVQAEVQALPGINKINLQAAVMAALNQFLDPLHGGPDGSGWPFGRDVYRSEIMRVIDEVPGVDYVASLALIGKDGQSQCGNICLGPTWLVAAGNHQITTR